MRAVEGSDRIAWEGLRTQEIAEVMGISPSGMRTRLQTAKALLQPAMKELERTR